jgi:DNA-binding CsgD family transcriptional regulator
VPAQVFPTVKGLTNRIDSPAFRIDSSREDLLRLLVAQVAPPADTPPHAEPEEGGEEILLDVDLDGARYLLMRMPLKGRASAQLSPREQEIVRLVAEGHPNKVIADVLSISTWTVCTHLRRIFAKLGVGSRAAMVASVRPPRRPGPPSCNGRSGCGTG